MDVCLPNAINMRVHKGNNIEGNTLSYLALNENSNQEQASEQMMTFPFMANAKLCNGCMECVEECLTSALVIIFDKKLDFSV